MRGSWEKGRHFGGKGAPVPQEGAVSVSWFRTVEEGRYSEMTEDKEDGSIMTSRDSYAQSECCVYCIMSNIMYIMYPHQKSRALLYSCFRKINHLVPVTICIHPLMYVKSCREQLQLHEQQIYSNMLKAASAADWTADLIKGSSCNWQFTYMGGSSCYRLNSWSVGNRQQLLQAVPLIFRKKKQLQRAEQLISGGGGSCTPISAVYPTPQISPQIIYQKLFLYSPWQ